VRVEDWQNLGIVCGSLLALLALLGVLDRKVVRPMWRSLKTAARLLEQLTGDKATGVPSLMDQLAKLGTNQVRLEQKLSEHLQWHSDPGGRPAVLAPERPNGGAVARHLEREG
jgi:hypothetical protein